jgi:cyclopropane fatty-acyl-phospholipid synthase-like methyltransferase
MRLSDFEDFRAKGTLGKNRQIYTRLYDYHNNLGDRAGMVGWLAKDSQLRNYSHILPEVREGDHILDFGCGVGDLVPFLYGNVEDFDYLGVDINEKFIDDASKTYPGFDFLQIDSPMDIPGKYDLVVALGVFTWYITREDFRMTLRRLYELCGRAMVVTCLHSNTAKHSWGRTYRGYDEAVFEDALPELVGKMEFQRKGADLVVTFRKEDTE